MLVYQAGGEGPFSVGWSATERGPNIASDAHVLQVGEGRRTLGWNPASSSEEGGAPSELPYTVGLFDRIGAAQYGSSVPFTGDPTGDASHKWDDSQR